MSICVRGRPLARWSPKLSANVRRNSLNCSPILDIDARRVRGAAFGFDDWRVCQRVHETPDCRFAVKNWTKRRETPSPEAELIAGIPASPRLSISCCVLITSTEQNSSFDWTFFLRRMINWEILHNEDCWIGLEPLLTLVSRLARRF